MEPVYKNLGKVRPTIDNNNWSIDNKYDLLTIVYDPSSNKSYISRKDVPTNIVIDNREYWLPFGVGKFIDNAIININYLDGASQELITYTLEEAIARIDDEDKRLGIIISFYGNEASDSHIPGWCLYQFMSKDLNDWNNVNAWNSIYYNRNKNVGWFRTESELLAIYPSPHKGDYCYIGVSLINSFVYRCYENGTWANTHELASANIGVTIEGNIRISENGTWIVDNEDTGIKAVGTGIEKMTYAPSQEDGGINILQVKLTDGNQFNFPIKNGNQGNSGIIVPDLETFLAELVNNLTTNDGTKALSAAQGVVLNKKIDQLSKKVTAFSGSYNVNAEQNTLSISGGYAFIGEEPYTVAAQVIDFSSVGYLNYILLTASDGAASFSIQPYDNLIADNQYIVGYITSTKKVELYSTIIESENWVTKQAKFSSFPTSCAISIDESAKTIYISNGYVFIGSSAYQVSAHSISFAGLISLNYIYFNATTQQFGISSFDTPLSANSYICGYATSNGKVKMTNQNFDEAFIKSQIGTPSMDVLPSADYLDGDFNVPQGGGAADVIYYDTRYIINKTKKISKLSILAYSAGTINVYFIAMDNTIVTSIPVSVVAGRNDISITLSEQYYDKAMYVGINSDGIYWNMASGQPDTYNAKLTISTGVVTFTTYSSAYAIEIVDTTDLIRNKINAISPFTDINEALASGVNDIVLAAQDFEISSPIIMREGMTIRGSFGKTRLILANGCTTAISASNVNNIKISDLEIVGTCPNYWYEMNGIVAGDGYTLVADEDDAVNMRYMGNERGIYLYYCENVILENLKINHINGTAIRVNHIGMDYIKGLNASNIFITNCYNGIYTENEHEFSQYTNFTITLCMVGLYVTSGNLIFTAGHLTRCRVAVEYVGGYNHAHGVCNGLEIKHNQVAGIICTNIANGQQFTGCYVSYSNVIIRDSKGVTFDALTMGNGTIICSGDQGGIGGNYIITLFNRTGSVDIQNAGNLVVQQNLNLDLLPN